MINTLIALSAVAFAGPNSGLKPGEAITPFHPTHVAGPLAGSTDCFPCTFQNRPQVQVWVNGDDSANVGKIVSALNKAMETNKSTEFKAMVVILAPAGKKAAYVSMVKGMIPNLKQATAVSVLEKNEDAVGAYKINTSAEVKNTVLVYKNWKVAQTMTNLKADEAGVKSLNAAIAKIAK